MSHPQLSMVKAASLCKAVSHGMGHPIDGTLDRYIYTHILQILMLPYAEWEMPLPCIFSANYFSYAKGINMSPEKQ
jgi:hypothetical protein